MYDIKYNIKYGYETYEECDIFSFLFYYSFFFISFAMVLIVLHVQSLNMQAILHYECQCLGYKIQILCIFFM